jgi:hypothetical protein
MAETPDAALDAVPPQTVAEAIPELDRPAATKVMQEILEDSPLLSPTHLRLSLGAKVTGAQHLKPQRIRELCGHPTCRPAGKMTFAIDGVKSSDDIWRYTCTKRGGPYEVLALLGSNFVPNGLQLKPARASIPEMDWACRTDGVGCGLIRRPVSG